MPFARSTALTGVALAAAVLWATACSSGAAPPTTTVPPRPEGVSKLGPTIPATAPPGTPPIPGAATITRFDVPASVRCAQGATGDLHADYVTDGARVQFTVDNRKVDGQPPATGSFTVPLPCDGNIHTVVLSTFDANGRATVQSRAVLTDDGNG